MPMHANVVKACAMLQKQVARYQGYNFWLADRAEEALNELVGNPHRTEPAPHQVRNALSNASKKLKRRQQLMEEFFPTLDFGVDCSICGHTFDVLHDIGKLTARLAVADKVLIEAVADGSDATEIAERLSLPVPRTRENLSRARARARALWKEPV
ncbi:hypothetical protein [Trinickia mobilis]|uniref:hypothetical protein n=1 Tax=Trinickia mobilis TaxID=2816356 RepID=UPI001A8DB8EB|nr:hypothetical protein [Trinickia mobilis]